MKTFSLPKSLSIFIGFYLSGSMSLFAQEIIAHRGASYLAPENTLASVKLGYALDADAVEIDIHLSADKRLMVIHDNDTQRTAGGENLKIADTDANKLRSLEVGSWKDPKYKGEKIPFLEEVLAEVPESRKLVIEIKSPPTTVPLLQQLIEAGTEQDQLLPEKQLILISFDRQVIIQAKQQMPDIPAYWLLDNFKQYSLEEAIRIAQEHGLEGLDVHYRLVDQEFMRQMRAAGLEVYVYTVNDPKEAKRLQGLGVKGITTDRPGWLREQLGSL